MKSVGKLSQVCSQIVLKCLYLARIGRPDILWSVNKLAPSITKWTKACDRRLNRLISYIRHTCEYTQYCHVGNTAKQCRLGLFQDSDFAGDLEDSKSIFGRTLCIFGSHTFSPISWMCKKQTSVSHSSTESEIISLDAGLRLDGIPALDLWDLIVLVLGNTTQNHDRTGQPVVGSNTSHAPSQQSRRMFNVLNNVDRVPSNVQFSHQEALLCVFEDNEAVIKMIINGRSPTMRHVSRTHRVALDWLFDRINLDLKTKVKYIDTRNQFADMLTKGNFTRDEGSHLLCLFNISHFSSSVCSDSGEESVTAKSKPMMNLVSRCSERTPAVLSSTAQESPGKTRHESQTPLSPQTEKYDRTVKPVVGRDTSHAPGHHHRVIESTYSASYSGWDDDKAWSSQERNADKSMDDRTGQPVVASWARTHEFQSNVSHEKTKHVILDEDETHDRTLQPVVCPQRGAMPQQFIIGDDEAELELSLRSRSLLDRVNDQVRKRQTRSSMHVTENDEKHVVIW